MNTHAKHIVLNALAIGLFSLSARAADPVIEIDYLPRLGTSGNAEGRIIWDGLTTANAGQYAVIGMLNVYDTYVKPAWNDYLNSISVSPLGKFDFMIAGSDDTTVDPLVFYLVERSTFTGVPGQTVVYSYMTPSRYLAKLEITRSAFWASQSTPPVPSPRPSFLPAGTTVTLSAPGGAAIWYTTDGSSPTNSPTRTAYTAQTALAVPAQGCLILKAAAATSGDWSDTVTCTYFPREDLSRSPFFGLNVALNIGNEPFSVTLPPETVRDRLQPVKPLCRWIRTFGTVNAGQEHINTIARGTFQLKTMIGLYITSDPVNNAAQLAGLADILDAGLAPDIVMVGNECILTGVPAATLAACVDSARALLATRGMTVPVGTVEAFGRPIDRSVLDRLDVLGLNFYPGTWDDTPFANAVTQLQANYAAALANYPDKLILLTETGAPCDGGAYIPPDGSVTKIPSAAIAANYLDGFLAWTRQEHIPAFYFQAYRQPVKSQGSGHAIEQHFGLMDTPGAVLNFYQPVIDKWSPVFASIAIEDGHAAVTWTPDLRPAFSYTVETTASLTPTQWVAHPTPQPIPITSSQKFFRVRRDP